MYRVIYRITIKFSRIAQSLYIRVSSKCYCNYTVQSKVMAALVKKSFATSFKINYMAYQQNITVYGVAEVVKRFCKKFKMTVALFCVKRHGLY